MHNTFKYNILPLDLWHFYGLSEECQAYYFAGLSRDTSSTEHPRFRAVIHRKLLLLGHNIFFEKVLQWHAILYDNSVASFFKCKLDLCAAQFVQCSQVSQCLPVRPRTVYPSQVIAVQSGQCILSG